MRQECPLITTFSQPDIRGLASTTRQEGGKVQGIEWRAILLFISRWYMAYIETFKSHK